MAIQVTEEMRQAVYAADCARLGHQFDMSTAAGVADYGPGETMPPMDVRGPDGRHPYLSCRRCTSVWLVVSDPGVTYDDAVAKHVTPAPAPPVAAPAVPAP